jgi:hypothetical protein
MTGKLDNRNKEKQRWENYNKKRMTKEELVCTNTEKWWQGKYHKQLEDDRETRLQKHRGIQDGNLVIPALNWVLTKWLHMILKNSNTSNWVSYYAYSC